MIDDSGLFGSLEHEGNPCLACGQVFAEDDDEVYDCPVALLGVFDALKVELAFPLAQLESVEKRLRKAVSEFHQATGQNGIVFESDNVEVSVVVSRKPRIYWNSSALDSYARTNPAVLAFREERVSNPSVRLRVKMD